MKEFFKLTKGKIIYLAIIIIILLISLFMASTRRMCDPIPCYQPAAAIGSYVYSIVTFGYFPSGLLKEFDNLYDFISGSTFGRLISFLFVILLHYILISLIIFGYNYFKSKNKTKKTIK